MSQAHQKSFSLNITEAMRGQLVNSLAELTPIQLSHENLLTVDNHPGVYRLFYDGKPVYVGKADKSLPQRLNKHLNKLGGRVDQLGGPLLDHISFYCLSIHEDLHALAPEKMLIREFKAAREAAWNFNGFGNNDPGRERDTSLVKENHFDRTYPINLEYELTLGSSVKQDSLYGLLKALKDGAPFNIRFPDPRKTNYATMERSIAELESHLYESLTVRAWLELVARFLPEGWLITALPGYVILYPETEPTRYPSRSGSWKSGPSAAYAENKPVFGDPSEIRESSADD